MSGYPDSPGFKEHGGTSQDAAAQFTRAKAAGLRVQILALLCSGLALTADEIAKQLGESVLSVRPRVSELRTKNLIMSTGERRKNASGMSAHVWCAMFSAHEERPVR